jgi:hypothetical protein
MSAGAYVVFFYEYNRTKGMQNHYTILRRKMAVSVFFDSLRVMSSAEEDEFLSAF